MKPIWMKEFLRDAEGEGAGGGATSDAGAAGDNPPPASDDRLARLEARLGRIASDMETQGRRSRESEATRAISERADQLKSAKQNATDAVGHAEKALADAFDEGEGAAIAKAQRDLTEAVAKRERADIALTDFEAKVKEAEARAKEAEKKPTDNLDDTNLTAWKTKHAAWYGVDADMTKASHEVDRQIRSAGVLSVGSKEYFDAIDREMSRRFPDRMGGTPPVTNGGNDAPKNTRERGKIMQSVADGWRRMGINVDDPKTVDRMLKHREKAVSRGILPDQPIEGRIITR